jgi:hypothetical protein
VRVLGWVLVVAAVMAAVGWYAFLSPFSLHRLDGTQQSYVLELDRAGAYILYEEFPGAAQPAPPSAVDVAGFGVRSRALPVQPLVRLGTQGAPGAYATPWHEGRGVAKIVVPSAGTYLITITPKPAADLDPDKFREPPSSVRYALGREATLSWWATPFGLGVMVLVPLLGGVVCIQVAARRRRLLGRTGAGPVVAAR